MKKLNVILDETTILNFGFFVKLVRRYLLTALIVPLFTGAFFVHYYNSQNLIYFQSQSFNNNTSTKDSGMSAISNILGESKGEVLPSEIISMYTSIDFRQRLAENLYKTGEYLKIDFSGINSKTRMNTERFFSTCGEKKECIIKRMSGLLGPLYAITNDRFLEKKFVITVKTLDRWSTTFLLKNLESTIKQVHLEDIKRNIVKQKVMTQGLLNEKKEQVNDSSVIELSRLADENLEKLSFIKNRIEFVTRELSQKKSQASLFASKLSQTKTTIKKKFSNNELKRIKKARVLNELLNKLRQDVSAIEVSLESASVEDSEILKELRREIKQNEKELYAIPNYQSYIDSSEKFFQEKQNKSRDIAFESKVVNEQLRRLESELKDLLEKQERLTAIRKEYDAKLKQLKPTMDYVTILEQKIVQLTLMESTIVPELVFSKNIGDVGVFKKTNLTRVAIFGVFTTIFFIFTLVFIRYLFDSKIYDEYELKKNFEDIEVIGKTPKFN